MSDSDDEGNSSQPPPTPPSPLPLKPEFITKNYKQLTCDQIAIALTTPELAPSVLSVISKLNDSQLQAASAIMTTDQIKTVIPKLQLQQTGVAVQAMNPEQIRQTVASLTADDRNLLMQNISLLTASTSKDDLQSFISFVDPLAMSMAVKAPDLIERVIECASVMTTEQIRVVVPLLTLEQVRDIVTPLEHESQIEMAINMITDRKQALAKLLVEDYAKSEKQIEHATSRLSVIKNELPELEKRIRHLIDTATRDNKDEEYQATVRTIKNTKSDIESVQMIVRQVLAALKLPLKIIPKDDTAAIVSFENLFLHSTQLGKDLHHQYSILTLGNNGGLIELLNRNWVQIKQTQQENVVGAAFIDETRQHEQEGEKMSTDIFEDNECAILLYEAVKQIGNPNAVGSHYQMTWNEIIQCGFRTLDDFRQKGITNLEQLQKFVQDKKQDRNN